MGSLGTHWQVCVGYSSNCAKVSWQTWYQRMKLTAHYSNLLQKKRGKPGGFQLKVGYKNTKIWTRKLYSCRESKILVVSSKHSALQVQFCAQVIEFSRKVFSSGRWEFCEILNWLLYMYEVKGISCYYKIRKFVVIIITNSSPSHHLPSSSKCISHYTQHY